MRVPRGVAPRSHTRRSSPVGRHPPWSLRGGAALEDTRKRSPRWFLRRGAMLGDTRERDPPWSLRGGAALGSAQKSTFEVKAWLECAPWQRLRRATAVESAPGGISLEVAPKSNNRGSYPRCQLQGGTLRGGLTREKASPRLGGKQKKRAFRGLSLIRNPYIRPAGVSRRAGADPLLSFHPSRVLSLPAMTGPRSCLLPCT